jgi:hypothetical protein
MSLQMLTAASIAFGWFSICIAAVVALAIALWK